MSIKFEKDRAVDRSYEKVPLKYTGIHRQDNKDKELVLMDDYGKHYSAAWRNNKLCKIGIKFLLKKTEEGFIFKDKEYKHKDSGCGWVI